MPLERQKGEGNEYVGLFVENANSSLKNFVQYDNIGEIDLFFFPAFHLEHYFLICVNLKRKRIDYIDNSSAAHGKGLQAFVKYDDLPFKFVSDILILFSVEINFFVNVQSFFIIFLMCRMWLLRNGWSRTKEWTL